MELALNLVWLVIAITSLTLAGWQLFRTDGIRASKWRSLIALCCLLVILFFVISMTDDIWDQQIASEEYQSLRSLPRTVSQDSHAKHSRHGASHHVVWVNSEPESIAYICFRYIQQLVLIVSGTQRTTLLSGRAPPPLSP